MMIRSFLPVGQGAFYCEQFRGKGDERINVIYDCGCLPKKKIAEQQIRRNFVEGEVIHALFISHLHEDHVNGIPYLLKYCEVKNIFLPLLTQRNKKYLQLESLINNKKATFLQELIENPYSVLCGEDTKGFPNIYVVEEYEGQFREERGNEKVDDRNRIQSVAPREDVAPKIFGYKSENGPARWRFIPFNFRQDSKIRELEDELDKQFERDMSREDIEQLWIHENGDDRKKIRAAYKKIGYLNTNSMTLFSGIEDCRVRQGKDFVRFCECVACDTSKRAGCLYTGDYDAKQYYDELRRKYDTYWKYIGCVQIPHHGSYHNYNPQLTQLNAYMIISAGREKGHGHPHGSVVKDLLFKSRYPYIVTEDIGSRVDLIVREV